MGIGSGGRPAKFGSVEPPAESSTGSSHPGSTTPMAFMDPVGYCARKNGAGIERRGATGSFEAGVILHLERARHLMSLGVVTGTSVGAVNALDVASWKSRAGTELGNLWLGLSSSDEMYTKSSQYLEVEALLEELGINLDSEATSSGLSDLLAGSLGIAAGTAFLTNLFGIVGPLVLAGITADKLNVANALVTKLLSADQVYSLEPTRELLHRVMPTPTQSILQLRLVFVSAVDGHPYFVDEKAYARRMLTELPREGNTGPGANVLGANLKDRLINAAIASSAIPIVFGSRSAWFSPTT